MDKVYTAIGLMSGTSLDGIDAAMIRTDGETQVERVDFLSEPYDTGFQKDLKACLGQKEYNDHIRHCEKKLTARHIEAVQALIRKTGVEPDIVGFHGQTIYHDPDNAFTWQIGDGAMMAAQLGIDVVYDFRSNDMKAGGQGAPFLPLYHRAVTHHIEKPLAVLNIGGVANVTFISDDHILAFDTGPGNALIDDFVRQRTAQSYDENGALAEKGVVDQRLVQDLLTHPYFKKTPPKSLDRDEWSNDSAASLSDEDGAATLTRFTVESIMKSLDFFKLDFFKEKPKTWYVSGGGRKNKTMMKWLGDSVGADLKTIDDLGLDGDSVEAEGFAYLAVRSLKNLPLSVPGTTGCQAPTCGGILQKAQKAA